MLWGHFRHTLWHLLYLTLSCSPALSPFWRLTIRSFRQVTPRCEVLSSVCWSFWQTLNYFTSYCAEKHLESLCGSFPPPKSTRMAATASFFIIFVCVSGSPSTFPMFPYTPFSNNFAPIDPHFTPPGDPLNDSTTVPGTPHPHHRQQSTTNLFGEPFGNNYAGFGQFMSNTAAVPFAGPEPDNGVGYFPVFPVPVHPVPYYPIFNTPQTPQMIPTQAPGIFFSN